MSGPSPVNPSCLKSGCCTVCEQIEDVLVQCLGCTVYHLENKVLVMVYIKSGKENQCIIEGKTDVRTHTLFYP